MCRHTILKEGLDTSTYNFEGKIRHMMRMKVDGMSSGEKNVGFSSCKKKVDIQGDGREGKECRENQIVLI